MSEVGQECVLRISFPTVTCHQVSGAMSRDSAPISATAMSNTAINAGKETHSRSHLHHGIADSIRGEVDSAFVTTSVSTEYSIYSAAFSPHITMFQASHRTRGTRARKVSKVRSGSHHQRVRGVSRRILFQ